MKKEVTDEDRANTVKAVEKCETLLELGVMGLPGMDLVSDVKKAKELMRNAMSCLFQARFSLQILQVARGDDKDKHIMALMLAEEFFTEKYKTVFGEFEAVMMVPEKG
ncbi:MAG: hypothetical protein A2W25_04405 [candidate division Zixibacteria bacterium RBG_16_53_22]|nr:MAG: hypothetical protein A2W25_04405 [candidate division Zixibacteria bacterium RBG_16_53_22]